MSYVTYTTTNLYQHYHKNNVKKNYKRALKEKKGAKIWIVQVRNIGLFFIRSDSLLALFALNYCEHGVPLNHIKVYFSLFNYSSKIIFSYFVVTIEPRYLKLAYLEQLLDLITQTCDKIVFGIRTCSNGFVRVPIPRGLNTVVLRPTNKAFYGHSACRS